MFAWLPKVQKGYMAFIFPFAKFLHEGLGLKPFHVSLIGLAFGLLTALSVGDGLWILALILLTITCFFDMADGTIARKYKLASRFGELTDMYFDRITDVAIIFALVYAGLISWGIAGGVLVIYAIESALQHFTSFTLGIAKTSLYFGYGFALIFTQAWLYTMIGVMIWHTISIFVSIGILVKRWKYA